MTICRTIDGVERAIELTGDELAMAYREERERRAISEVQEYLDYNSDHITDERGFTLEQLEALVPLMASLYKDRIDNSEHSWEAVTYAVEDVLHDYEIGLYPHIITEDKSAADDECDYCCSECSISESCVRNT